jgi:hypothetical protein
MSLVTFPGLWCNSSISAREADGPGANPGFLTDERSMLEDGQYGIRLRECESLHRTHFEGGEWIEK